MSEDAKNLLGWFGKRKENVVHNGIRSHALAVLDCVMELGMALRDMSNGEAADAMKCIQRLYVNEREADALEDSMAAQLSLGELSAQEREDLLHFVRKTDSVANWCKEAGLHVRLIKETDVQVSKDIWDAMVQVQHELESEITYLFNAIKILGEDNDEIEQCIQGVKDQEARIDKLNFDVTKSIFLSNLDVKATMLASKVVGSMEEAADAGKSCADTITILNIAKRV